MPLPQNHPKIDIKWIDEYIDKSESQMLELLCNPPKGDFAKEVSAALGFKPHPGEE